jgi:hypothetical protein
MVSVKGAVSKEIIEIGQALSGVSGKYSRNIWQIYPFNNKLYLAHGDMNDSPGALVVSFNPANGTISNEYTLADNIFWSYTTINNELYAAGGDATEGWAYGNFYRLADGTTWTKHRNIVAGIHVFDLVMFNGALFAPISQDSIKNCLPKSTDYGMTWSAINSSTLDTYNAASYTGYKPCYYAIILNGKLYAGENLINGSFMFNKMICVTYSGGTFSYSVVQADSMFPNSPTDGSSWHIIKPTYKGTTLYYLPQQVTAFNAATLQKGVFKATDINVASFIAFSNNEIATDLMVRDTALYALAYIKNSSTSYTNKILKTTDDSTWEEFYTFESDTLARSFLEVNGEFYIGMGCTSDNLRDSSGKLYKITGLL